MKNDIEAKIAELKELRVKQLAKVTPEIREAIPAKKEEIINLIKEL